MQLQGFHIDTIHTNRCHHTGDKATTTHEQPKITSAIQTPSGSPDDKRPRGRVVVREERRQKERRGKGSRGEERGRRFVTARSILID